jgi:ATP-dependent Clp protease adaptor protein ClpS
MTFKELVLDRTETIATDRKHYKLVLYNDDVNTFDWVIESLMDVCKHGPEQAEQAAMIVHYRGKCAVKSGTWDILEPPCSALLERGLSAKIE